MIFLDGRNRESEKVAEDILKVEQQLDHSYPDVHVGQVDAEREVEVIREFPVVQTPTLRLFKNGKRFDFHGKEPTDNTFIYTYVHNVPSHDRPIFMHKHDFLLRQSASTLLNYK